MARSFNSERERERDREGDGRWEMGDGHEHDGCMDGHGHGYGNKNEHTMGPPAPSDRPSLSHPTVHLLLFLAYVDIPPYLLYCPYS